MATNVINPGSRHLVVQNYFTLVQAIAGKIKRRLPAHVDVEDLVQTGMIGLLEASNRFDASRMVEFSSYANARITGAILDELRKWDTCSRQDRRTSREIDSAKQKLRGINGQEPEREDIAMAVGLGLAEYEKTLQRLESGKQPSLQTDDHDSDRPDELSQIPSKELTAFDEFSKKENFQLLRNYIHQLKPRQKRVLELYYFGDHGLKEIGETLGVGEARVSQIHKQAVSELRRMIAASKRAVASSVSTMVQ